MPLLSRKRVLAAKIESTPYTAIAVSALDGVFNVYDPIIQPTIDMNERPGQVQFGHLPAIIGQQSGTLTFRTDLVGNGSQAEPAWATTFLPACGFSDASVATEYLPITDVPAAAGNVKTITAACYVDGVVKKIAGAVGTFVIVLEAGKPAFLEFTFTGRLVATVDDTIIAPSYPTRKPMRWANSTTTIGSMAPCFSTMRIDAGNQIMLRPCQSEATSTGLLGGIITARRPTVTASAEAGVVLTDTIEADWIAMTERALSISMTDGTDTIAITAPKMQVINLQEGDREGLVTDEVTYACNRSATDDELKINFS